MSEPRLERHQSSTLANSNRGTRIAHGVIAFAALLALDFGGRHVLTAIPATEAAALMDRHGPELIGIPAAAGVATILDGSLRAIDGSLHFRFLGLKADPVGAAATAWAIAFLTFAFQSERSGKER